MKPILNRVRALTGGLIILGLSAPGLSAQEPPPRDTLLAGAKEIIEASRYCGLITFDQSGNAKVRTMDPFPPDGRTGGRTSIRTGMHNTSLSR